MYKFCIILQERYFEEHLQVTAKKIIKYFWLKSGIVGSYFSTEFSEQYLSRSITLMFCENMNFVLNSFLKLAKILKNELEVQLSMQPRPNHIRLGMIISHLGHCSRTSYIHSAKTMVHWPGASVWCWFDF